MTGREGVVLLAAAAVAALLGVAVIPLLRRLRLGQSIRNDGPATHLVKAGTPTMGGILILGGLATGLAVAGQFGPRLALALLAVLVYGLLGFLDDFLKVARRRPLGLKARYKLLWQAAGGLALGLVVTYLPGHGTDVRVPFTGHQLELGSLYPAFVMLLAVGTVNAVNLTDGLDGLAAGLILIALATYAFLAAVLGVAEITAFCLATAGGCVGFLVHNRHPARVFLGDTGAMALGGALAAVAVLTRTELVLPIIGGVFVAETLSVMAQVASFRLTGRRVLRMCPLHHHFELGGWAETRVVRVFWATGLVLALLGIAGMVGGAP
ncbi:MAG: phospho-N-acetylmuramoyl-pentapeptide-transferase [bacterium]|nr:phospho-N-acetylmuramoyl-pentapeptide-transferase [bacterium]